MAKLVKTGQTWSKLVKLVMSGAVCVIRAGVPRVVARPCEPHDPFHWGERGLNSALIRHQMDLRASINKVDGQIQDFDVQIPDFDVSDSRF